ncbi:TPA: HNH endonuclease [Candidatus Campbellbacteria bacterium]|uniref:HNH endonuclease n=1 Tax=Candidatus Nomurabacteria bacterium GW2011_GWC2_42_20 TaxID=1618756 RepID=A0A0G1CFI3_9BACT|nr:MAG: HNH endonuclease [Parcubacteria group bacterium GW2011_GWC1_42_11]KKS48328.1 MAG: HNH endonuclease [Candidatus Nomurabacteria bacterium GW2011_GWC2_42_20]KKT09904.1 MAG: HNH endonuclease [Candidatus Nomurabacteria bacterium GW2011_GWB1_43_20]HBC70744.1 HNH endonuclease [Candidatus Campbellbacteria bacterium]
MSNLKMPRGECQNCGGEPARAGYKYCSNVCQLAYQHKSYIIDWKAGTVSGLSSLGTVSTHIKRYLREKYGNRCVICSWAQVNVKTGQVPLVADHIDGKWRNNTESNLRLICPNCDAISPTYAALNKGNGRINRVQSRRSQEARLLVKKKV